jgi:hypothetical protein
MIRALPIAAFILSVSVVSCALTPPPTTTATTAPTAAATTNAPAAPSRISVDGTVQTVDGTKLTFADGKSFTLSDKTTVVRVVPVTLADLKVGPYVAVTAKRQPDNSLLASIVNVFPTTGNTFQCPMTGGNIMTNATIDQISGNTFTVTFTGGGAKVVLAPDAKINQYQTATLADVKPGATATVITANGATVGIQIH